MSEHKKFKGSFGTIAFIETPDGSLKLNVDVFQGKHTSEEMMSRIRAIVCGMKYLYSHNDDEVEALGAAYMDGLETGIGVMQQKPKKPSGEGGSGPKIGFSADL